VINGIWDSSLTLTGEQNIRFLDDTDLGTGMTLEYVGDFNVNFTGINGAKTITLGGDVVVNTASTGRTIVFGNAAANLALNVDLGGAHRKFVVGPGRSLGFVNEISNGSISIYGVVNFSGSNTYIGDTRVYTGNLSLNGTMGSVASTVYVHATNGASTVTFNSSSGTGTVRANAVALDGAGSINAQTATLAVAGNSGRIPWIPLPMP
jgi:hypothetical protein